jgi:hypothetical protein
MHGRMSAPGAGRRARQAPPQDRRLSTGVAALQRAVGNRGMATLARAPKGKAPAKGKKLGYRPYELNSFELTWDFSTLMGHAGDMLAQHALPQAAAYYEQAYKLNPTRALGTPLYRIYKELGDMEKAEHWLGVSRGQTENQEPPVWYQSA